MIAFVSQYFVSHVEYLRMPERVIIFDFGRLQKWIQHTQLPQKMFSDSFYLKMPEGVLFSEIWPSVSQAIASSPARQ